MWEWCMCGKWSHNLIGQASSITPFLITTVAPTQISSMTFPTYHWENLLMKRWADWLPAISSFLAGDLWLLGNLLFPSAGRDELLLVSVDRADSRSDAASATHARPWSAGRFGTLRTLLCHLQRRLWLAGVWKGCLNVGHWLAGWRHSGNGAASEDSWAWTDGDGGGTVMVTEGRWVVIWGKNRNKNDVEWIRIWTQCHPCCCFHQPLTSFEIWMKTKSLKASCVWVPNF